MIVIDTKELMIMLLKWVLIPFVFLNYKNPWNCAFTMFIFFSSYNQHCSWILANLRETVCTYNHCIFVAFDLNRSAAQRGWVWYMGFIFCWLNPQGLIGADILFVFIPSCLFVWFLCLVVYPHIIYIYISSLSEIFLKHVFSLI